MSYQIEWDEDTQIYSYHELERYVEDQWKNMSDVERSMRMSEVDPTFEEWVLGKIKPGNMVYICWTNYKVFHPNITLWYRFDKKKGEFVFNHIEDGWNLDDSQDAPVPISDEQKKSWKNAQWKFELGNLEEYVVKIYPQHIAWMENERCRGI